ncbi:MAG: LysM peptidoglycan-binding domain-containing protein, partial [Nitrospinota bacterium]
VWSEVRRFTRSARAAESWTPTRVGGQERYRVQRGDTLGMIAQNLGSTVEAIAEFNALSDPGRIYVGQVLLIPTRPEKRTRRASPAAASREEGGPAGKRPIHVVRSGDTLWEISLRYGVRLKDLLAWNRLPRDARIRPGDTIRLSPDKP